VDPDRILSEPALVKAFPLMDLDLNLVGRKHQPILAEVVRSLTEADVALLSTERGIQPSSIKKLTDNHHALARCLSTGMSDVEASAVTGYTPSRISVLRDSPLFSELVSHYRGREDSALADFQERMHTTGLVAVQELADRLETEPEKIGTATLIEAVKALADRTGHGPQSKTTNLNVNVSLAERVAEGRRRAQGLSTKVAPHVPSVLGPVQGPSLAPALEQSVIDVKDDAA
jgi:hypothetical protein